MSITFSQNTLKVLENYASINPSLVFKEGSILATISIGKTIMAKASIEESIPDTFAIYDLSRFLSVLGLFTNPTIDVDGKSLTISSDGGRKVNYTCAEPNLIFGPNKINPYEKALKMPSIDVSFNLEESKIEELRKAAAVLKTPDIVIEGYRGRLLLKTMDVQNPSGDVFTLDLGENENTFKFIIRRDNLKILPGNYLVELSAERLSKFTGTNIEYFVSLEKESFFNKD